ncbi:DUF167 domain-containing protein [Candidatus Uhrbacteria bacterium]|nr:DUF167 domain-containing protein [Candidatus Uhrbacteria bacterium]
MRIEVTVRPNARVARVVSCGDGEYRVDVDVPALHGRANERLLEILAEHFQVRRWQIQILRGTMSREKLIEISHIVV